MPLANLPVLDRRERPSPNGKNGGVTLTSMRRVAEILCAAVFALLLTGARYGVERPAGEIYIVLLDSPSVVQLTAAPSGNLRAPATVQNAEQTTAALQQSLLAQLRALGFLDGIEIESASSFLLSRILVKGPRDALNRLRHSSRVRGVYPNRLRSRLLDTIPQVVQAGPVWTALGGLQTAGQGIRIAVVDDGIDVAHPMFADTGIDSPEGFPQGEVESTNAKVIVARSYVCPEFGFDLEACEPASPVADHGTIVASIAAGRPVEAPLAPIQGLAPAAYLGNYNVFGDFPEATTAGVIAAIEDAVRDGMQVINLSLGGNDDDPAEQAAIDAAQQAGVVVVASAGNEGPDLQTVNAPGDYDSPITVGAVRNPRVFAPALDVTSSEVSVPDALHRIRYWTVTRLLLEQVQGPFPLVDLTDRTIDGSACSPLSGIDLQGRALLLPRGVCDDAVQVEYAIDAGAGAIVLAPADEPENPTPSGVSDSPIPVVGIPPAAGTELFQLLESGAVEITFGAVDDLQPVPDGVPSLSLFSSRGPGYETTVKPDLVAPGEGIYAAVPGSEYAPGLAGTSFSAPVVTGAVALLRQRHPGWSPQILKSAVVNTAVSVPSDETPAKPFNEGAGLLDLARAANVQVVLDPVSLNFGLIDDPASDQIVRQVRLRSLSEQPMTLTVDIEHTVSRGSVDLQLSRTEIDLGPGEEQTVTITADLRMPVTSGAFEGRLRFASQGQLLTEMVFWGAVTIPSPDVLTVNQSGAADFTSVAEAVAAAGPGNVVELSDSGNYEETVTIGLDRDAVPQNGLTLRAKTGQSPQMSAPENASGPAVGIHDVDQVTLEGLHVRGGRSGIELTRASAVIRGNLIEETRHTSGSHGISLTNSGATILDNTIRSSGRDGIHTLDSTVLVENNQVSGNAANGFLSDGAISALFNNEFRDNTANIDAQNARFLWSLGLLKQNVFAADQGPLGDGLHVQDDVTLLSLNRNRFEGNRQAGLRITQGAQVQSLGDQILMNGDTGVVVQSGGSFHAHAARLSQNRGGLTVSEGSASLSDSLIDRNSGSTAVVGTEGCGLDLHDVTVGGNSEGGIDAGVCEGSVQDSILAQNGGFDVMDSGSLTFRNNLIGDGTLDGVQGNFSGDPRFGSAVTGDFSLLGDSPAIDRGSNLTGDDLLFHFRPEDGDGDGSPRTDLGALEFGSYYSTPVSLPLLRPESGDFLGIAWLNQSNEQGNLLFRHFGTNGGLLGEITHELEPGRQQALLRTEWLPGSPVGSLELSPDSPLLQGMTLFGPYSLESLDGGTLEPGGSDRLVLTEFCSGDPMSDLYVTNRLDEPLQADVQWAVNDSETDTVSVSVPARGTLRLRPSDIDADWSEVCGALTVTQTQPSDRPGLSAMNVLSGNHESALVPGLRTDGSSQRLVAPQIAAGAQIDTWIHLVSPSGASEARIELFDSNGNRTSERPISLPTGGQWRMSVSALLPAEQLPFAGWAAVSVDSGQVVGTVRFEGLDQSYLAALPLQSSGAREFALAQLAETEELFTGIALLNDNPYAAILTVEAFSPDGQRLGIAFLGLGPGERLARTAGELFEMIGMLPGGYLRVRSTLPLSGLGIFAARDLRFYSAVPPQILAQ